ncbi:anthranilate synthase component I family protein [Flavobacterium sp.]|uniref:anthranilate synthase component I family protein n=1 Tax=Flavobacterium sp. TaxID=239 RepID=UPI0026246BFA|nr:anthranilate synthase component I family protein [Flavobacterium sp.]MDD3004619.1 anthranilate synthase component I family protein [Flavobacterium sp.]
MRTSITKKIDNLEELKTKLLAWSQQFREIVFLDSNNTHSPYSSFENILAVEAFTAIQTDYFNAFEDLDVYQKTTKDWLFGYLSYDLKNDTEKLFSENKDGLKFPDLFFFQPKKIFFIKENTLELHYLNMCEDEMEADYQEILDFKISDVPKKNAIDILQQIPQSEYLKKVHTMLEYIQKGIIYEANFCMEFFAEQATIHPLNTFQSLNKISKAPFTAFFKNNKDYAFSASPERYLKKIGDQIISQPIKGTAKRFQNQKEDELSKTNLANNPKERAENIMIVDLVRNDLSKTAQKDTVKVEELCGIYSFEQVHQMISTITSKLKPEYSPVQVLKSTFPMGSMTGAPKISAMKCIEEIEESKRGLYSGAIGYFTPENDFDFNVVIRSILYKESEKYVSFMVGSAITSKSEPQKEYEECLLKARAMRLVLNANELL